MTYPRLRPAGAQYAAPLLNLSLVVGPQRAALFKQEENLSGETEKERRDAEAAQGAKNFEKSLHLRVDITPRFLLIEDTVHRTTNSAAWSDAKPEACEKKPD